MQTINLNKVVFFLALLPYSPNVLSFTDLEPFCFIICLLLLCKNLDQLNIKNIDMIWIVFLCFSISCSFIYMESLTDFRILFGGISFLLFYIYGYALLPKLELQGISKLVQVFWILWIIGILLQVAGVPTDLMSDDRTTSARGFTSFAPEATFAALQVISITVILIFFREMTHTSTKHINKFLFLGWAFPIFIHISATALACYLGGGVARVLIFIAREWFLLLSFAVTILFIALLFSVYDFDFSDMIKSLAVFFDGSKLRIIAIWEYVVTGRILEDASAFDRLTSSLFFLLSPYALPQISNHSIWINDVNTFIATLGSSNQVNYSYRNLSGLGQLNVLTGMLFIIPLRGLIKACIALPFKGNGVFILVPAFVCVLFFSTPLAHPLFGMTLGLATFVFQKPLGDNNVSE
jgi:hypothetical protein